MGCGRIVPEGEWEKTSTMAATVTKGNKGEQDSFPPCANVNPPIRRRIKESALRRTDMQLVARDTCRKTEGWRNACSLNCNVTAV